jgi:hypothetical protein|tara:strand:- start:35719 stop:35826 length:108 start_codon:yes stop_codon:yes gene_type:complete
MLKKYQLFGLLLERIKHIPQEMVQLNSQADSEKII